MSALQKPKGQTHDPKDVPTLDETLATATSLEDPAIVDIRKREREHRKVATEFLREHRSGNLALLHTMRWSLEPQIRLMKAMLSANEVGEDLETMQLAEEGGNQSTRLSKLWRWCHPGGLFHNSMKQCHSILTDEKLWASHDCTEEVSGQVCRYVLRTEALLHEIMLRCKQFPYRVFGILEGADAEAIMSEAARSPCLLDPFTASLLQTFPTADALRSREAGLVLQTVAGHAFGNIHGTERIHSAHSRRARTRTQTHKMRLDQIALRHHGRVAPKWLPRASSKECVEDPM